VELQAVAAGRLAPAAAHPAPLEPREYLVPAAKARLRGWEFIDLSDLGVNTARSYLVALLRIVLLPLAFLILSVVAVGLADAAGYRLSPSALQVAGLAAALGTSVVGGIAVAWSVARIHRRPWLSLISADLRVDWRRLAIGAGVEVALLGALYPLHLLSVPPWRFASTTTAPVLGLMLLLIPLQAASEEILFRGYLTQALGRLFRNRGTIVMAVALIFGALHFDAYGALTIPYILFLSLTYSLVSLRDEKLELVVGAHAANNLFVFGALGFAVVKLTWPAVALVALHGIAFYGLTRLLVRLLCERRAAP
jgi:membrane protease YdiL (CAAX protease family)